MKKILLVLSFIFLIILIYILGNNYDYKINKKYTYTSKCNIKLEYPVFKISKLDKEINNIINDTKTHFYKNISNSIKNELILSSRVIEYNSDIHIVFRIESYTGGNHYQIIHDSIHYDRKLNTFKHLDDYVEINKFKKDVIKELRKKYVSLDESRIDYDTFYIDDNKIVLIFSPLTIRPSNEGTINITMPLN